MAGLLAGGAVAATAVIAFPAFAQSQGDDFAGAGPTTPAAVQTSTSTTSTLAPIEATTVSVPSPEEQFAAFFSAMTPEQQLAFKLYTASPEERAAFAAYISPPPPPPKPAPKPAPKPTAPASQPAASGGSAPNAFLACVRQRESGGNYRISNGQGYYGAYQFSQSTWNNTANHAGRTDLVGVNPAAASPADQDAMAASLYAWQGRSPWAGPGC
jgi:hypothetical protein